MNGTKLELRPTRWCWQATNSVRSLKVHEQYDDATQRKRAEKAELAAGLDEPEAEDAGEWEMIEEKSDQKVKTNDMEQPCSLKLSVWKDKSSGKHQLRAEESDGKTTRMEIRGDMVEDLDPENPWVDAFARVGLSSDDPPRIVLAELIGEKEYSMPPNNVAVLCRVHRFDAWRYYVSGTSLATSFMSDYVIVKDDLVADDDVSSAINSGTDGNELIEILLGKMSFQDEGDGFYFGEA